jgi:putative methionine-R-sulfoxide reductase with GAF domain
VERRASRPALHKQIAIPPALDSQSLQGETRVSPFAMPGSTQPEEAFPAANAANTTGKGRSSSVSVDPVGTAGGSPNGGHGLEETELDSALQLLVERAQYITGATGTALALPHGEEMVCRASAGSSAPPVGVRLQVRSGLTGESIARRQLLRCDNAESDPRVNLETCRALGIASIVVLPLLRRNGEVRGLFELFSDHPYAFEERDLIALERMADLTLTALDLAEQRQNTVPAPTSRREPERPVESPAAPAMIAPPASATPLGISVRTPLQDPVSVPPEPELVKPDLVKPDLVKPELVESELAESAAVPAEPPEIPSPLPVSSLPVPASVPEAMLRVQKCASCGFPVSEGRTLCLDCEQKDTLKKAREKERRETAQGEPGQDAGSAAAAPMEEEFVPAFLANAVPVEESWLANHVNLLAIVVLILGILVAVVVFR